MNKILNHIIIKTLFAFTLAGCANDGVNVNPVEIPADIAAGTSDFAFDFFKNLQKHQDENENVFVSPLSLHMALGMLLNGATDETATEIQKTLKIKGIELGDVNKAYKTLLVERS